MKWIARCFLEGLMTYFVFAFLWLIFLWEYIYNPLYFSFFFIKSYSVILKATDEPSFFFKLANCVSDNIIVSDIIYICNESFYHNSPRHKHSSPELVPGPNYWCFFSLFLIHLLALVLSSLSQILPPYYPPKSFKVSQLLSMRPKLLTRASMVMYDLATSYPSHMNSQYHSSLIRPIYNGVSSYVPWPWKSHGCYLWHRCSSALRSGLPTYLCWK